MSYVNTQLVRNAKIKLHANYDDGVKQLLTHVENIDALKQLPTNVYTVFEMEYKDYSVCVLMMHVELPDLNYILVDYLMHHKKKFLTFGNLVWKPDEPDNLYTCGLGDLETNTFLELGTTVPATVFNIPEFIELIEDRLITYQSEE